MAFRVSRPAHALSALILLSWCLAALANGITVLPVDAARSHARFSVKVLWLLDVHGSFAMDGEVRIDTRRDLVTVLARIDATPLHMDRDKHAAWASSAEFLDVARYPAIEFSSAPFPRSRLASGGELPGQLTMHGARRQVMFHIMPAPCADAGWQCPIRVHGIVRRSEFGMHGRRGSVSDRVQLDFEVFADASRHDAHGH